MECDTPTSQAYAELQRAFDFYNDELFDGALPPCLITMQRKHLTFGYFSSERFVHRDNLRKTDAIAMNPSFFCTRPVAERTSPTPGW